MVDKEELRPLFQRDWEKHYGLEFFREEGFVRKRCECGKYFWTLDEERAHCGEPEHTGYLFINNPVGRKKGYVETWNEMASFYHSKGHTVIPRYPVVARWRDDLYFTIASIAVFQPHVVSGEAEPPADPLLIPQPSLRFKDVENVGYTGRHFTSFVMVGQHSFGKLWKEEAIRLIYEYMVKEVGIPPEEIVFHEDVWSGGGNFGPSIEYFVRGLELGNVVFMQYEETEGGYRELRTKVLDHGIGLSRFAWIRNGSITPFEIVMPRAYSHVMKDISTPPEDVLVEYARLAGKLDFEEGVNEEMKRKIEEELGYPGFFEEYEEMRRALVVLDHTKTLLFAVNDGALPSNTGGGYNLRLLLRRMFAIGRWDIVEVARFIAEDLSGMFPELREGLDILENVVEVEKKRYTESRERARRRVVALAKREGKVDLELMYESYGITPEDVREILKEEGMEAELVGNPYLKERQGGVREKKRLILRKEYPSTRALYYEDPYMREFTARVLGVEGEWVVLDRTAFYPEGGGQEHDEGWLNGVRVTDVRKVGTVVVHKVEDPSAFREGMDVRGVIDWERRISLMRHHTATHIVLASARKVLGKHVWQQGTHKAPDKAHIDISHYEKITEGELARIEREANRVVMENLEVRVHYMKRAEAEMRYGTRIYQGGSVPGGVLRLVEIPGVDIEACGGTHVRRTGEVGFIKILRRESVADGVERLVYVAGERALEEVQRMYNVVERAASLLRTDRYTLDKAVEKLWEERKEREKELERLKKELAALYAEKVEDRVLVVENIDPTTAIEVYKRYDKPLAVIARRGRPNIMLFGEAVHLKEELISMGARGGGKGERVFLYKEGSVDDIVELLRKKLRGVSHG